LQRQAGQVRAQVIWSGARVGGLQWQPLVGIQWPKASWELAHIRVQDMEKQAFLNALRDAEACLSAANKH